jgi:hypothetical protein
MKLGDAAQCLFFVLVHCTAPPYRSRQNLALVGPAGKRPQSAVRPFLSSCQSTNWARAGGCTEAGRAIGSVVGRVGYPPSPPGSYRMADSVEKSLPTRSLPSFGRTGATRRGGWRRTSPSCRNCCAERTIAGRPPRAAPETGPTFVFASGARPPEGLAPPRKQGWARSQSRLDASMSCQDTRVKRAAFAPPYFCVFALFSRNRSTCALRLTTSLMCSPSAS